MVVRLVYIQDDVVRFHVGVQKTLQKVWKIEKFFVPL